MQSNPTINRQASNLQQNKPNQTTPNKTKTQTMVKELGNTITSNN